jgi:glycogen debranching enzyme GlgX/4-alpha-glucanotransferase
VRSVVDGFAVSPGRPEPLGVTVDGDGINVAVVSAHAGEIWFCLFEGEGRDEREVARIPLVERSGDVWHAHVAGIGQGRRYGLRAAGPFAPDQGHRFNPAKLLLDPYATRLDRPFRLDPTMFSHRLGEVDADLRRDEADSAASMPKGIVEGPWTPVAAERPRVPWDRTILYELHVKGYTRLHPDIPEEIRGTFAGLAHPRAIDHLAGLGVTTVELLPSMAWVEERHLPPLGLTNAWGYNPVGFLAPDPRLAPGGWDEVRAAVAALQEAGIEVILDVVLNHSGESDQLGPTLSMRGLDNALYYRLRPDQPRFFIDDTGCGNTLALDRPPVLRLAMDSLRIWAQRAGLDGFRFDLAATLGRRPDGFDPAAPLLSAIAQDPLLRDLKLIAEPWDLGPGGYQPGGFPAAWAEWNDRYRDDVRRWWRGDGGMVGPLATRQSGSQDLFGRKGRPSRGVNFIVAHDGFSLADLVAHEHKHNEANGEFNRDGTNANHSWNHGAEGETSDPAIRAARLRDQRALLATLLFSRGTPMLAMGSETGRSQGGNNNAYAQDNALNWLDWSGRDRELVAFVSRLAAMRTAHPALHADRFLTGEPGETGLPDVEWLDADGRPMREERWNDAGTAFLGLVLATPGETAVDRVLVVAHRGFEPRPVVLPWTRPGHAWRLALDSASGDDSSETLHPGEGRIEAPARAVLLYVEEAVGDGQRRATASGEWLDRLAQAAGIAPVWWDETGIHHAVTDETKRALLASMGLPSATSGDVTDHLAALSEEGVLRPLPKTLVGEANHPVRLSLPRAPRRARVRRLYMALATGETRRIDLDPDRAGRAAEAAPDGRRVVREIHDLPPLPAGLHRFWLEDHPDSVCQAVIAPSACVLPDALSGMNRRLGLGAHLYALRSAGDQGIGDFGTLARMGEEAGRLGAATVGLNPLHALFPGQRDRASPYHPSDRRFLDWIYLDLAALGDADPQRSARAALAAQAGSIERLRAGRAVDYPAVSRLKQAVLREAFAGFDALARSRPDAGPVAAFGAYLAERGEALQNFARFEALSEIHEGRWTSWPEALRDPSHPAARDAADPARVRYHAWLQWLAETQLAAADRRSREAGLGLGFYRDIAVGAAPDSAEAWSSPGLFARGASIGAPPDLFSAEGQIWDLPPPIPLMQEASAGEAFAELARANMRHAGLLRIDHVMGLTRLFWVPEGARGRDGAYVKAPLDLLLARLALESHATGVAVVGEDLGTVPDGLRERLSAANVLSYRVLWFEREGHPADPALAEGAGASAVDGFKPPPTWPALAAACVSTHDLPTLAGWWDAADIVEKHRLGLMDAATAADAKVKRRQEKRVLLAAIVTDGLLPDGVDPDGALTPPLVAALHAYVGQAPSCLMLAQVDDLVGEPDAVNLPGTDLERPNWRRRLAVPVEEIGSTDIARQVMAALANRRNPG